MDGQRRTHGGAESAPHSRPEAPPDGCADAQMDRQRYHCRSEPFCLRLALIERKPDAHDRAAATRSMRVVATHQSGRHADTGVHMSQQIDTRASCRAAADRLGLDVRAHKPPASETTQLVGAAPQLALIARDRDSQGARGLAPINAAYN